MNIPFKFGYNPPICLKEIGNRPECQVGNEIKWKTKCTTLSDQLQKSNRKIAERGTMDSPKKHIHGMDTKAWLF